MAHIIPPRRDQIITEGNGMPSLRYTRYIEEVTGNTNENTDQVAINTADIATNVTNIAINTTDIATINTELGDLVVITTNYTTTVPARIICNGALTVTLNASPGDDEKVYIKRINGSVTISGNGNLIDGESTQILDVEYTTVLLVYSSTLSNWYIM